jgi:ATP-binding cassette subfamily B multidrug efflux pump
VSGPRPGGAAEGSGGAPPGVRPSGAPGAGGGPRGPMGGGPGRGPMGMGMGLPPAKARDFRGSLRRLLGQLGPDRKLVFLVILLAVGSVAFAVVGPKILGEAVNLVFEGAIGGQMPAGATLDQVVAGLRAQGQNQLADMLSTLGVIPGVGIDFGALAQILMLLVGLYVISSLFGWVQAWIMAGVTNRTVYRLRREVDEKLGRLPLRYFDRNPTS